MTNTNISSVTLSTSPLQSLHFLHIPKTAGTSIRTWIMDVYRETDWLPCHFLKELQQYSIDEVNNYHFFSGHLGNTWYNLLSRPPHTFTWLRHPIQREISQYFYIKKMRKTLLDLPLNPFNEHYINAVNELSLSDLCQSSSHLGYYDNLQVRTLAGLFPIINTDPVYCDDEILEIAKTKLLECFFFGVTELMDLSITLLVYYLGFPPKNFDFYLNKSKENDIHNQFTIQDLEKIQLANLYDQKLYDFALLTFEKSYAEFANKIDRPISSSLQATINLQPKDIQWCLYNNFQDRQRLTPRLKKLSLDFSEAVFLNNWYPRFYYEPVNKWLRWSGPESVSSIYLPLAENINFKITFNVFYVITSDVLDSLTLKIRETSILLHRQTINHKQDETSYYQFTGVIHSNLITSEPYTELKFVISQTFPMQVNDETWQVGFAMDGLTITS